MDGARLAQVLERADTAGALPRLGGMARSDGVVIVSERFWAFARRDGTLYEGTMPRARPLLRHIPLVRGLVRLSGALAPLARGRGIASVRERAVLLAAVLAPAVLVFAPERVATTAAVAITVAMLAWLLRGRTLHLHGAEHRAIAAVEQRALAATWAGVATPSRFALRCGTNFAALVVPVTVLANAAWPLPPAMLTPLAVTLVSLAVTMELWQVLQTSAHPLARVFFVPGLALQRLTTREPSLDETRVALVATAAVLDRELTAS